MILLEHLIALYISFSWLHLVIFSYLIFFMFSLYLANRKRLNWWFYLNTTFVCFVILTIIFDMITEEMYLTTFGLRCVFYFYSIVIFFYNMISLISFDIAVSRQKLEFERKLQKTSDTIEELLENLSSELDTLFDLSAKQREVFSRKQEELSSLREDISDKEETLEETDVYKKLNEFFHREGMKRTTLQTILSYLATFVISFVAGLAVQYTFELIDVVDPKTIGEFQELLQTMTEKIREKP